MAIFHPIFLKKKDKFTFTHADIPQLILDLSVYLAHTARPESRHGVRAELKSQERPSAKVTAGR